MPVDNNNFDSLAINKLYEELNAAKNEIETRKNQLQNEINQYNKALMEYRIKSVYRVLGFMSWDTQRLTYDHIQLLLVHCMNKLNGNIDGTELKLEYDYSYEEGQKRKSLDNKKRD